MQRLIRVPIRIVGGQLMYLYGGPLPQLLDCEFGELVLPEMTIKTPLVRRKLREEQLLPFVPAGTELRVC